MCVISLQIQLSVKVKVYTFNFIKVCTTRFYLYKSKRY